MSRLRAWLRGLFPHQHVAGEWRTAYEGSCIDMQIRACRYCPKVMDGRDIPSANGSL